MKEAEREEQDGGRGVGVYSAQNKATITTARKANRRNGAWSHRTHADVTDKTSEESEVHTF